MRKSTHDDRLAGIDADTGEVKKCSLGAALRTPSGRREFLQTAGALAIGTSGVLSPLRVSADANQPNVLLVMTDDQGFGDLGVHGNDKVRTPNIDAFARQSVEFTQFYVCPVCAPTRSSLMTGRYNYRTGVVDTWIGRAMMHGDEVTMAEMFGGAGYRTGIFGKWHLGDCAPMRSIDQGFQESLVHYGGGMTQPSDAPGASYFDPVLVHNGEQQQYKGYCTDIFATACRQFMEAKSGKPFFAYLATNAPHVPLQIEERYMKPYLSMGLDETTARVYGMEENIDENFGMLMKTLEDLGISDNTIVIFMTDNGPQQQRYNAGMRGRKGTVYEGGIRVPFYIRWPQRLQAGESVATPAAHIDVAPTLLAACGIEKPDSVHFDGRNLLPLIEESSPDWPDRYLFFQWHRGDKPERFRDCAVRGPRYKLVNGKELYDLKDDPAESTDIAAKHPDIVAEMRKAYLDWFRDVSGERGYEPPLIHLGDPREKVARLTPQDWRGPDAGWSRDDVGYWEVEVMREGNYSAKLIFDEAPDDGYAIFKLRTVLKETPIQKGQTELTLKNVDLPKGQGRLEAWLRYGKQASGMNYVEVWKE